MVAKKKNINSVLKEVLEKIEPSKKDLKEIDEYLQKFLVKLKKNLKKLKIHAEIFVGGSFAKKTAIKKDYYDVDIFLRFDEKYEEKEMSNLASKALNGFKDILVVHGSRDYFKLKVTSNFSFEIIPVKKVKTPKESENITDLSYSHVKYINKKANLKILDGIKLAKAFCYATNCYGAESYIHGFSGYGLELLVCYYGGFVKFIKAVVKVDEKMPQHLPQNSNIPGYAKRSAIRGTPSGDKLIIDIEKQFKNKQEILLNLNASKLQSPIILIDPTYKQRNALAALSPETFNKFKKECEKFLKNPSTKSFEVKKTDLEKVKKKSLKNKFEFILLEAKTVKQEGDVAGSKLLKFYNHLTKEIEKNFEIKNKGFDYGGLQSARYFFVVKRKKEILFTGPSNKDIKNVGAFKKNHKSTFEKAEKLYAYEKVNFGIGEFVKRFKKKNNRKIKEMYVEEFKVV